jgi:putative ABC transport system permease protein
MAISPTDRKYNDDRAVRAYYDQVLELARHLPGVQSAAVSDSLPPNRQADADTFMIEGQTLTPGEMNPAISKPVVGPGYFETMRIPLREGRYFTGHDTQESTPVAIVSESLARHFFPGQDPIGRRIKQSAPDDPYLEIVGVVGDVKYTGLQKDTDAAYYTPYRQDHARQMFLVVRSTVGAAGLGPVLRRQIQSIDRGVTLNAVSTMQQALDTDFAQPRFNTILLTLFAGIALLLAFVGIYGVIAYSVTQRTHEIGIRMALGAGRANVLGMVIGHGARLALLGIAVGLAGAYILTRLLSTLLFGVGATDLLTFATVGLGLLAVALLAAFIPAHRATRISPVVALRYE